ncbi:hypothetical protein GCM10019016_010840 [Streptomyces prasinosporus]|uniref:Uncharacterized protein n=1 Tax=Streptomyces prasinosporus TaxID=68256 RepID=A0ABP6TGY8_9ACTN|nr:hypothetical protein GCM10010332_73470 [Streptomyces albogriseolus]
MFLPEMNLSSVLAPGCQRADPDLGAIEVAGLPVGAEAVYDLGQGLQPQHTLANAGIAGSR